jgi:uncharacterized protein (DUF1800 family)
MSCSLPRIGKTTVLWLALIAAVPADGTDPYTQPAPPSLTLTRTNAGLRLQWTPYPGTETYEIHQAPDAGRPFLPLGLTSEGLELDLAPGGAGRLFLVEVEPIDPGSLLAATVLHRLAYGPTPDEVERVRQMGADAYITEQLAPENISEDLPHDRLTPAGGWQYVTATGRGSSSRLYVYLTAAGEGYIDDLKLVAGEVAEAGPNLIRGGDFEASFPGSTWVVGENHAASMRSFAVRHGGTASLHLKASEGGETRASAIVQDLDTSLSNSRTYTLSYWWLPSTTSPAPVVVRLSGSGIVSSPGTLRDRLAGGAATLEDLRSWHILNAIQSRRQLLQVLLQFLDNHFVTQHSKAEEYLDQFHSGDVDELLATGLEFRELTRWREALMSPDCTFYDLLKVSAESPTMIIYLDTVNNRGGSGRIANENYARELLELFTFGVDNGYDQHDIESMARVWTGWSVRYVRPDQEHNPFAVLTNLRRPGTPPDSDDLDDYIGTWSFVFKDYNHDTSTKYLFYEYDGAGQRAGSKVYPTRFGPPHAGKPYAMTVSGLRGTNGIREAQTVLRHLADQPFTQEYISVKLCRLFVHDDFRHGYYDYTAPALSPEAALVKACMTTWESTSPKGQVRPLLNTIFSSELFRNHAASQQKIKTPFEFAVGAIRSLRARRPDGAYTATADPEALQEFMERAGSMELFDRTDPDGFPEAGPPWVSAGTLAERLRFVQGLLMPSSYNAREAEVGDSQCDPAALTSSRLPPAAIKDAEAVADLFVAMLFPAEGRANLAAYRQLAVEHLNTGNNGVSPDPFSNLSTSGNPSPYDVRLRAMVAMLMTLPRFQEQ